MNYSVFFVKFLSRALVLVAIVFGFSSQIVFSQTTGPQKRQLTLESIEVVGNTKTSSSVIIRQLNIRPGEPFTINTIEESTQHLRGTNFFKSVDVYSRPGSEKGKVILIVEVKERLWPYFQFEGGHNDIDGWFLVPASLRFDNLFGRGSRFGLQWRLGDHISKLSLRYKNSFNNNSLLADIQLFTSERSFVHFFENNNNSTTQNVRSGGLDLKISGLSGWYKHLFLSLRSENYEPDDYGRDVLGKRVQADFLPIVIQKDLENNQLNVFGVGLFADTRDNSSYPQSGFWGALVGEIVNSKTDETIRFPKLSLDARLFQPFFKKNTVLALHLKGAFAGEDAPFYERFYLGGANSLRGYQDRRLTPVGWGNKMFLATAEIRFPLTKKNSPNHRSSGVLFFDAGGNWQEDQVISADDIYTSIGLGFRLKLPVVGTTRVDFAFPLRKIDDNFYKFHISLGHTF